MAKTRATTELTIIDKQLTLSDLSNPETLEKIFSGIRGLLSNKQKIGFAELDILLEQKHTKTEIIEKISQGIIAAPKETALALWNMCTAEFRYGIVLPDAATVDLEIIEKLEIEGDVVRHAFLSQKNMPVPIDTAYTKIYGKYSYEDAEELAVILETLWNSGPYGKVLIQEFFHEIDLRILYLIGIAEIEQFLRDGGEAVYIALKTNDQMPAELHFLSWLQSRVGEKFSELSRELLNPIYPEQRKIFWETFFKMKAPHVATDHFVEKKAEKKVSYVHNMYTENDLESGSTEDLRIDEEFFEHEMDDYLKHNEA